MAQQETTIIELLQRLLDATHEILTTQRALLALCADAAEQEKAVLEAMSHEEPVTATSAIAEQARTWDSAPTQ